MAEKSLQGGEPKGGKPSLLRIHKNEHLKDPKKKTLIKSQKKVLNYNNISLSVLPQDMWEIAIILKKNVKNACERNRIKRIIREVYRNIKPLSSQQLAMVFTVRSNPKRLSYQKLKLETIKSIQIFQDK